MAERRAPGPLPPPPPGASGWPWEAPAPVAADPAWPAVTIVIPSLAQGTRIERALRSALLQGYPRLELMVIDAGSADGTMDVVERYRPWLAHVESRPDRGQSHAINKGWRRATGEVFNWLCCDDLLLPGALARVGAAFAADPALDVVAGGCRSLAEHASLRTELIRPTPADIAALPDVHRVAQPACFWRRRAVPRGTLLREGLAYAMDYELWNRLRRSGARWRCLEETLAEAVMDGTNKVPRGGWALLREVLRVNLAYARGPLPAALWYALARLPIDALAQRCGDPAALRPLQVASAALAMPFYGRRRVRALGAWSGFLALERATRAARRPPQTGAPRPRSSAR